MTRESAEAFRRTVLVDWPNATQQQLHDLLVTTARQGNARILQEAGARGGALPTVTSYANTPGNTNLDSVKLPGPIVYLYDYRREILFVALDALRAASPVQSGKYRSSHLPLLNGVQINDVPETLQAGDVIVITNPVVYARRIEIGQTKSGKPFVVQVPNRIYETVAKKILRPKYRNVADIQFGYIELTGAYKTKAGLSPWYGTNQARQRRSKLGAVGTMKRRMRQQHRNKGKAIMAPAITIKILGVKAV